MPVPDGAVAPDFALRDQHGATVTLSSLRGRVVVLMFYPFAFSRVCSGELGAVRDDLGRFQSEDVQVLGLSCDPMFTLRAFAERDALTFPLLSDFWPHGEVATSYGVLDPDRGCATRSTFVVDRAGVLRWSVHNDMPDARDLEQQLAVVAGLGA